MSDVVETVFSQRGKSTDKTHAAIVGGKGFPQSDDTEKNSIKEEQKANDGAVENRFRGF